MKEKLRKYMEQAQKELCETNYQEAVIKFSQALAVAELLQEPSEIIEVSTWLIKGLYLKQEMKPALKLGSEVAIRQIPSIDLNVQRRYYTYMAACACYLGLIDKSFGYYEELSNFDDRWSKFVAFVGMGINFWRTNRCSNLYEISSNYFDNACLYADTDDAKLYVYSNRAEMESHFGFHKKALLDIEKALQCVNNENDKAIVLNTLGQIYTKNGEYICAKQALNESLEICLKTKNKIVAGYNHKWLARLYRFQRMFEPAIQEFELALEILKEKEMLGEAAECCWELRALYKEKDSNISRKFKLQAEAYLKALEFLKGGEKIEKNSSIFDADTYFCRGTSSN